MKEIRLTKGLVALVDDDDFEWLSKFKWCVAGPGYARRRGKKSDGEREGKNIYMHREIMGLVDGDRIEVDHIDRNKANNQRSNLRVCTHSQNHCNIGARSHNRSGFKGVSYSKAKGWWIATVSKDGAHKRFAGFKTPEAAYAKYCEEAKRLHGEFANVSDHPISAARREESKLIVGKAKVVRAMAKEARKPNDVIKFPSRNTSGYVGVSWHKGTSKWQAKIGIRKKTKSIGYFDSPEEAHRAYCDAARELGREIRCDLKAA